ncbi:MarR family winged helix-turn-helix transcriptional regulator [Cohnella zeiphila]|uniref:MarR family transcriptional regulator n=1 Tax=Cohnella zeiphila TaxID=2761120 RepID=A0A7X0VZM5_9BACL|nr:MarR family transcriptional regulator [Cohnella zeiphila]MBB6734138.1 MarR family transcriptional regulator [Cohnella zeiphila]
MLDIYFKECLYFSANRLGRIITKMAEDAFASSGVSPTAAFLLMALYERDGISQKELGQILHLQPSTVTRLIEKLAAKQLLYNRVDGRLSLIYATDKGKSLEAVLHQCWDALRERYRAILGDEEDGLSLHLYEVCNQLEQPNGGSTRFPAAP